MGKCSGFSATPIDVVRCFWADFFGIGENFPNSGTKRSVESLSSFAWIPIAASAIFWLSRQFPKIVEANVALLVGSNLAIA